MKSELLTCKLCGNDYNKTDRLPKLLPKCGHTMCSTCILKILTTRSQITCSSCNLTSLIYDKDINLFTTNMSLMDSASIPTEVLEEVCLKHKEKMGFVCLTDKVRLCQLCLKEHKSKSHKIETLEEVAAGANLKVEQLETQIKKIEREGKSIETLINKEEDEVLKRVTETFAEIRNMLALKEQQAMSELKFAFELERSKTANNCSGKGQLIRSMRENISTLKGLQFDETFLESIVTTEFEKVSLAEEQENVTRSCGELQKQLTFSLENFETQTLQQIQNFHLTSPLQQTIPPPQNINIYAVTKLLRFESRLGCLFITPRDAPKSALTKRDVVPDIEEWKGITRVGLEFSQKKMTHQLMEAVQFLWSQLGEITHLKIDLSNREMNDQELLDFCTDPFWTTKSLQVFELNLQGLKVKEKTLAAALDNIMHQLEGIYSFKLLLSDTNIIDQTMIRFAQNLLPFMSTLENFQVSLANTPLTDQGLIQLFVPLPKVKNFMLNLSSTKATDQAIEALSKHCIATMNRVEAFEIYLFSTNVTDESIVPLFVEMPLVKKYALGLSNTKISDKALEAFQANTLMSMGRLESLELYFSNTEITDSGIVNVFVNMESIQSLILGLSGTNITDKSIELFVERSLPTLKVLETLELYLFNTAVTDESVILLFSPMKTLKNYILGLSDTDITDQSLSTFALKTLPSMKQLETLELFLADTGVTDQSLSKFSAQLTMASLKRLVLDLNYTDITDKSIQELSNPVRSLESLSHLEISIKETQTTKESQIILDQLNQITKNREIQQPSLN